MEITVGEQERLTAGLAKVRPHLDERAWRLLLGAEARAVGRGGIKLVAGLAGLSARGAGLLQESLALTHAIGGTVLTEALYSAFGKAASPLRRTGRDNVVGVLKELAVDAASVGVTLGLEVCNRDETNVVNTARDTLARAEYLSADNVVIHLDTYHVNIEEDDFSTPVFDVGDRLGYVHIGENHRGDLGSGHLDFPAFFGALAQIDSSAVLASGLSNDLAIWRNLWDDGGDLARRAHAFISEQLEADPTAAGPR